MPRASASSKRQSGASGAQQNNRHDNGLVGPAKRVTPKKSHGHLDPNGPARSGADHGSGHAGPPSVPPLPDVATRTSNPEPSAHDVARRTSVGGYSETSSDSGNFPLLGGHPGMNGSHRSIDVNATKNIDVHKDSGPLELVTTVLRSLPMQDTIAILIILMHIPSVSLTLIYGLFAFLTFAPPVSGGSGVNVSLAELWEAITNTPSLITVAGMDFIFFLFWAFLWPPLQDGILDMAKPIIALTLGGAGGSRGSSSSGFTACFGWVFLYHTLRSTRSYWAPMVRHMPEAWRPPAIFREPFDAEHLYEKKTYLDLVKSGFAIHILMQGIMRGIKDWYLRREKATAVSGASDPEAGKTTGAAGESLGDATSTAAESEATVSSASTSTTAKKKRKQSAHVRQQQPLWAALASTKIVFMKEYEFSNRSAASAESNATDIHNLGNAPFDREVGRIWIAHIGSDEVSFSTSRFPDIEDDDCDDDDGATTSSSGLNGHVQSGSKMEASAPFYVRVNNAFWQPTRIFAVDDGDDEVSQGTRWTGDIYGLRPASKYVCEFVDGRTNETIFTATVRTAQEALQEADSSTSVPNGQPSQRPDSPATTLRNSIVVAEGKLSDEKNRLRSARKDWKTRVNALKKETDLADNQLSSAGSQDEKLRAKIRQQEQTRSQHEAEAADIVQQLKNFDTAPELHDRKKKMERGFYGEKKVFDAAQKEFKEFKAKLDKEVNAKEVENTGFNTKRNKLATRIARIESELHNITDANNRGIDEAERRRQERASREEYQSGIETYYRERLNMVRANNAARAESIQAAHAQVQSFHEMLNSANGMPVDLGATGDAHFPPQTQQLGNWQMNPAAQPHFPSGILANSFPDLTAGPAGSSAAGSTPAWHSLPPTAPAFEPRGFRSRGRSSSMLSDVSGFTQSSGEADSPAVWPAGQQTWTGRNRANGGSADSGSTGDSTGSGSNSNSGDPASPT